MTNNNNNHNHNNILRINILHLTKTFNINLPKYDVIKTQIKFGK